MIIGIISCISLLAAMNDSEVQAIMAHQSTPVWFQLGSSVVGLVVTVICGFVILKGKNWGRYLYVVWSLIGFVTTIVTSGIHLSLLLPVTVFVIFCWLLFRPSSSAFFQHRELF